MIAVGRLAAALEPSAGCSGVAGRVVAGGALDGDERQL